MAARDRRVPIGETSTRQDGLTAHLFAGQCPEESSGEWSSVPITDTQRESGTVWVASAAASLLQRASTQPNAVPNFFPESTTLCLALDSPQV
ncbi:hypothetical protein MTO96_040768 [Rhipicephalus appendiculatus]